MKCMRTVSGAILFVTLIGVVSSQAVAVGKMQSGFFRFSQTPPPLSMTWEIATAEGNRINATFSDVQPFRTNQLFITSTNASSLGVNFDAWLQALNDPAYTRSIITANGVSQEAPLVRLVDHLNRLDHILLEVRDYVGFPQPGLQQFLAFGEAVELDVVPEPISLTLVSFCSIVFHLCGYRWSRLR